MTTIEEIDEFLAKMSRPENRPRRTVTLHLEDDDDAEFVFTTCSAKSWDELVEANPPSKAERELFKATFGGGFGAISFGQVAESGLSEELLLSDLTVIGSLAGGGTLGEVDLIYVPEQSTLLLAAIGSVVTLVWSGRCRGPLDLRPSKRTLTR